MAQSVHRFSQARGQALGKTIQAIELVQSHLKQRFAFYAKLKDGQLSSCMKNSDDVNHICQDSGGRPVSGDCSLSEPESVPSKSTVTMFSHNVFIF